MDRKYRQLTSRYYRCLFAVFLFFCATSQGLGQTDLNTNDTDPIQPVAAEAPIPTKNLLQMWLFLKSMALLMS